jgi:hypothetical protein
MLAAYTYGWGVTMVVAGAVFAVSGALLARPGLSSVAGFAMIAGFFCPWIDPGHITGWELARAHGLSLIALAAWGVPAGGAIAAYGGMQGRTGRALAVLGGLVGIAAIGYLTYRL